MRSLVWVILLALPGFGYVRLMTGLRPLARTDFANIQFLINDRFRAGATNADGRPMLTADSDPAGALRAAAAAWTNIPSSTVRFAPPVLSNLSHNSRDDRNVFVLLDDPEIRSVVGSAIAVSRSSFFSDGRIVETDILFNPNLQSRGMQIPFSTTGAENTIDLQVTATHELGHSLGAGHSGFQGATMYHAGSLMLHRTLSSDELAFVREAYPEAGSETLFGQLTGRALLSNAAGARGVLIAAVDPDSGVVVGALTGPDGAYSMSRVPPGRYLIYAEPLDGPVLPGNVGLSSSAVDTDFFPTFFGSTQFPTAVPVTAGRETNAILQLESGASPIDISLLGRGRAGGAGDVFAQGAVAVRGGERLDLLLFGRGLNGSITESQIRLIGAGITLQPGTLRLDPQIVLGGNPALRFTVDVANQAARGMVSVVVSRAAEMAVLSGSLVVEAARQPISLSSERILNAAALTPGPVAPESWVSVFAENLARELVIADTTPLPTTLGGTTVTIVDSRGATRFAPLQFVSPTQMNLLVPGVLALGTGQIRIETATGFGTAPFPIDPVAPGIFTANADGRGPAAAIYLLVASGGDRTSGLTFRTDQPAGSRTSVPLDLGAAGDQLFLTFFGTGIRGHAQGVRATIGGVDLPVLAAVAQGEFLGLDQINAGPVSRALAGGGEVDVVFTVDGRRSNTVRVSIR